MSRFCFGEESAPVLLTLVERTSRKAIVRVIANRTVDAVAQALDEIEKEFAAKQLSFKNMFKTIAFDNGKEFKASLIERSCMSDDARTTVCFAHPYSSYERGTNENFNGLVRRFFPKGTNFTNVTQEQVTVVENAINSYPRRILNYASADHVFADALSSG
jgi:IS30 family transposase